MKKFLLFLCFSSILLSNEIVDEQLNKEEEEKIFILDLSYIKSLEKGNKRDFYINEFLKKQISPSQAYETLSYIDNMSLKLFFNFAKKYKDDETLAVAQCMNMDINNLIDSYADCIVTGLNINKLSTLSAVQLNIIKQKTLNKYPDFVKNLKVISSSIPFTKLIIQNKDDFYNIFFNVTKEFREKYFNYKLPKRTFQKIFKDKNKFNKFLQVVLTNKNFDVLNKSLLKLEDKDLNENSSFLLALNALRANDINSSIIYLNNAFSKGKDPIFLDKIIFWKYLLTKDENILIELSKSEHLNFYSYLANEILKNELILNNELKRIDIFDKLLEENTEKTVALLYSIAKIKSNFEPNKISKEFNLGIMQLKPSLIKSIANNLGEEYNVFNQFKEEVSLKYANIYLNSLEYKFKKPLYLFLAYNNSRFSKTKLKFNSNTFEPFYTLELLLNNQEEAKEFLLNYVLYYNQMAKEDKISLLSICQNLNLLFQKKDD